MQCACNYYVSPTAYIGLHSDKSTSVNGVITAPNLIISLSLGSLRQMALRPIRPGREGKDASVFKTMSEVRQEKNAIVLDLEPGSLVIFSGIVNHTGNMRSRRRRTRTPLGSESHSPFESFRHMESYGKISSIESLPLPDGPACEGF